MPSRNFRAYGGLVAVGLILIAIASLATLLYRRETNGIAGRQADLEVIRVNLLTQLLQGELRPVVDELRLLADGEGFHSYVETGAAAALQSAIRRAVLVSVDKPLYDQVRFLDPAGKEIFRIDRGGQVVPEARLRNKGDRLWFRQAEALAPGTLFISAFGLNIEGRDAPASSKPTLRFAVPVFDTAGRRRGLYVIDCRGAELIAELQRAVAQLAGRVRLLNAQGYWLKGADPGEEWGFELPGRAAFTLARTNPALWARMQQEPTGQAPYAGGLLTWQRLRPADFTGLAPAAVHADDAFLIVASAISQSEWEGFFAGLQRITLLAAATLLFLTLVCAWLFRERLQAMRNLRRVNEQLELRVRERTEEVARSYEQLQHREQLLEETGRLAKVGGWEVDVNSDEGIWTPEIARIHDIDPAMVSRKGVKTRSYTPESQARLQPALQAAREKGTPYDLDLEIVTARGEHKWVRTICRPILQDGKVTRLRGALQDITAQKKSETRLHAQLQRLHMLEHITRAIGERQDLPSILQVVARTVEEELPLDFCCVCLYEAAERTLTVVAVGLASVELAGRLSMTEEAHIPIDENGLSRCVRGQLVCEADIEGLQFAFPQRLASVGLRSLVAAPLQIESKVFGALISARREPNSFTSAECEFLRQLSEHVALAAHQAQLHGALQSAYEELRSTQQSVMQQERLRVLGQMASGIAHDINNAISPIALYTDSMLEREPGLSDRARGYLRIIQQATGDVAETVARMREFYRQQVGQSQLVPLDINAIVPQVIELTRARWQAMPQQGGTVIEVKTALTPDLPAIMGAKSEIREALTNLVFNAVDAMPQGGLLTLRTRLHGEQRIVVEVADTGVGMNDETRRRCLEPFFTTKGERGTGLGLAMVYGIMQRHDGALEIDSAPGSGTTVRLCFTPASETAASSTDLQPIVPAGLRILLIDDDPILLKSLRETLEQDGHTILTANGGKQGLDVFHSSVAPATGESTISLVITDLGMPHVDGRSVARGVKQASRDTPVILLTGWGERLIAEGDAPANVDRVLSKPPRLRELRRALAELN